MKNSPALENDELSKDKLSLDKNKLFIFKLIVSSIFIAVGLSFYLFGMMNTAGVFLIIFGALWNFFVDINTFASFILSLLVGAIYAMFAVIDGLYINAILYTLFYVPLQFYVWIRYEDKKDLSIKKNDRLTNSQAYYYFVAFVVLFVGSFACALTFKDGILPMLDAFSACLLGLCACLQSFMFREYYFVRPVALVMVLELWLYTIMNNGLSLGSLSVILLYLMYLVIDVRTMYAWVDLYEEKKTKKLGNATDEGQLSKKLEEYNALRNTNSKEDEKDKIVS